MNDGASGNNAYSDQIERLKAEVPENKEYGQQLDTWLDQIDRAKLNGGGSSQNGGKPEPQIPRLTSTLDISALSPELVALAPDIERSIDHTDLPADQRFDEASGSRSTLDASALPPELAALAPHFVHASERTGVPAVMLATMTWQESRGNLGAHSVNGGNGGADTGLMQINVRTFRELQEKYPQLQGTNLSDPATNILAGAFYMKDQYETFGSWDLALRGYNSGPGSVDINDPNITTTGLGDPTYVIKINDFMDRIRSGVELPA